MPHTHSPLALYVDDEYNDGSAPRLVRAYSPRDSVDGTLTQQRRLLPDPLPLVGRTSELAELEALLEPGQPGPSVVFVRGEGGVGKSRLVAELANRAERRSWRIARGRAYPVEVGVPYALFSDAWLPILRAMDENTLTVLTRGGQAELRHLFPALPGSEDHEGLWSGDPDEMRTRITWNFGEFLKRFADREPVLCVLEDLQWADESSLHLLHSLGRQCAGYPILFLCTYNDQGRDSSPLLVQTERDLTSSGVGQVQHLQALALAQVTELVARSFGASDDAVREFSAVLFGWTRGNAFFVEEIVRSLVETGRIRYEAGTWVGWDAKDFGTMPGSIRDAVIERQRTLSDPAQAVSMLAAVVGTRVSYPTLTAISGLGAGELLSAVEELCGLGILNERSEAGQVVYHFAHPLVQQILYTELGLARASVQHGEVADALESYYGERALDHADELAFHYARTDGSHGQAKAAQYLAVAGIRALDRRADQEAINYLQEALDRVEDGGVGPTKQELIPLLARAHTHLGDFEAAVQLWTSALEQIPPSESQHSTVRRALGMAHFWCGRHNVAFEHLDAGLESARSLGDEPAEVRLLVAKGHCLHELGLGDDALETVLPALPMAERLGDPGLLARVHRALALLYVWIGPPEKAEQHANLAISLAEKVGDLAIEFWARWGLAVLSGMRGDTHRMSQVVDQVNELADRHHSPVLRLWTADMVVELAYGRGEWDIGIAEGEKAINLARSLNQRTLLPRLLVWTSQFYTARGEHERANALVSEAIEISGIGGDEGPRNVHQVVPTYIGMAHHYLGTGDFTAAIEAAEKGLEIAEGTGYVLWSIHQLLPVLAESCLWAGEIDRAQEVGQQMRQHAERIDHRLGIAWADACDALVQWKAGDPDGSIPKMYAAADALEAIPMLWYAARLRRQLSARLRDAGRLEESREQLDLVWEMCVKIGAGVEREKARMNYRDLGLRAPATASSDGPLGLTPEELAVAQLVAQGHSNKKIAEIRNSAVRTVSTHLSNIYTKHGIGGPGARVRLGNLVRDAGATLEA